MIKFLKNTKFQVFLLSCCFFAVFSLYLTMWHQYVQPLPDNDSIVYFYWSFLNYLQASLTYNFDFSFLVDHLFTHHYPLGYPFLAYIVNAIGLGQIIINEPYLLVISILIPLSLIPSYIDSSKMSQTVFGFTLFFLPCVQIVVKCSSIHGFNVVYSTLAILSAKSYLRTKSNIQLLLFISCFWVAIIMKHLGLIYFLCFTFSWALWSFTNKKWDFKFGSAIFFVLVLSLPFYNYMSTIYYLSVNRVHSFTYEGFELVLLSIPIGLIIFTFILRKKNGNNKIQTQFFLKNYILLLALIFFSIYAIVVTESNDSNYMQVQTAFFICCVSMCLLSYYLDFKTVDSLIFYTGMLVYFFVNILYISHLGKQGYVYFLPIILILFLSFQYCKRFQLRLIILVFFFLASNFFPSYEDLSTILPNTGHKIYEDGLRVIHFNPLGWKKSNLIQLQSEIHNTLEKYEFDTPSPLAALFIPNGTTTTIFFSLNPQFFIISLSLFQLTSYQYQLF